MTGTKQAVTHELSSVNNPQYKKGLTCRICFLLDETLSGQSLSSKKLLICFSSLSACKRSYSWVLWRVFLRLQLSPVHSHQIPSITTRTYFFSVGRSAGFIQSVNAILLDDTLTRFSLMVQSPLYSAPHLSGCFIVAPEPPSVTGEGRSRRDRSLAWLVPAV